MPTNLANLSNSQLAMGFGMCVQSRPGTTPVGALSRLHDELAARGLIADLLGCFDTEKRAILSLAVTVDRTKYRNARRAR